MIEIKHKDFQIKCDVETKDDMFFFIDVLDMLLTSSLDLNENSTTDDNEFIILDCGDYKLMVSNWEGDSSNYYKPNIEWDDTQKWVDDNVNKKQLGGYNDWTVPTKYELDLMYQNKDKFTSKDKFTAGTYWSSNVSSAPGAWQQDFGTGTQLTGSTKTTSNRVRAVRRLS